MFWFPVLLWLALEFSPSTATWTWTAATAISIGLFYHAGNVQMWVYGVGFWGLVLLLRKVRESWSWREFATCLPALLIGIGIAVPLLIPQWKATQGLERGTGGEGIERGLMSLLYPNPLVNSGLPNGWGTDTGAPGGQLYYAGTFFTLAWIAGLAVVAAGRDGLKAFRGNPFLSASVVALLLALGSKGGLWILHMKLPVLQAFAHPIKFLPFLQLFSLVLGGLILQRAFAGTARTTVAGVGMFAVATLVMFYHASISSQAFYVWKDRPDSQVPAQMLKEIGQQRIYPLAPWRSPGSGYSKSLAHNFASAEHVQSIEGYEPLWRNKKPYSDISDAMVDDLAMVLRRYGVSLLVVHSSAEKPLLSQNKGVNGNEQLPVGWVKQAMGTVEGEAIFKDDAIALYKVGKAEPLARNEKNGQAIPLRVEGNSVVVDTSSMGGAETIMVNYFWRPGIVAKAGPQILEMGRDQFSRLLIKVPAGVGRVEVSYEVAWRDSLLVGMAVVGLGLLMGWKLLAKA